MYIFMYMAINLRKFTTSESVICKYKNTWYQCMNYMIFHIFTGSPVVRVVITIVEQYDQVKIKLTSAYVWLHHFIWSSENCIVGVASRSGRINQWQCSALGLVIGWFFHFCFWLWQPSFHWIISNRVVSGIERNGNVLILPTLIPLNLWLRSRLRFSIFTRS